LRYERKHNLHFYICHLGNFTSIMDYLNQIKNRRRSSQMISAPKPVLSPEDEAYLRGLTAGEETVPLPREPEEQNLNEAPAEAFQQAATSQDAVNVPLPTSPAEEFGKELGEEERRERKGSETTLTRSDTPQSETTKAPQKKKRWSAMFWRKNTDKKVSSSFELKFPYVACANIYLLIYRTKISVSQLSHRSKPQLLLQLRIPQ
jgi:hypothetical protein